MLIADGTVPDKAAAKTYQADLDPARLRTYLYETPMQDFFDHFQAGAFGMIDTPELFSDGHVLLRPTTGRGSGPTEPRPVSCV